MPTLYYVGDPMCSWCWGFSRVLDDVLGMLPSGVNLHYVMGGLAPDSDELMPTAVRKYVQDNWREVAKITNAKFNWDFWQKCHPRRSTYPACRAAIAGGRQGALPQMFQALQRAYYLEARNPSDTETHFELASEIGLDMGRFAKDLGSEYVERLLQSDFTKKIHMGVNEFPTMVLGNGNNYTLIMRGWASSNEILNCLREQLRCQQPLL
ncbi:MAG: hypothetical protein DF168_01254 [Candidatus Moanabacter tarae]|uniref:DSBA-like thioredoxin domain-containing protein n=1 Tax=Candidatus Moanibacter tarae TaxID=2200854 RepID=A0A2Z4AEY7_9BACT|nr:MAG: hypothetical protein DF168_01254 [Candidatus Moanabacter tarae]